jgi:hypothetical protein
MVKNSKKSKEPALPGNGSAAPTNAASGPTATAKPVKSAKATARPKSAGKAPAPRKSRTAGAARKIRKSGQVTISDDDIRLRAYFISEKRRQSGLPGDSSHDWLEAHRQLLEETGKSA